MVTDTDDDRRTDIDDLRQTWEGQMAYSEEFQAVVGIEKVLDPLEDDGPDDPVAVDLCMPDGRQETTDLAGLRGNAVAGVSLDVDADAWEARELLDVLTAGIEAVEEGRDEPAEYARRVRTAVRDQHQRIDNSLTTRRAGR